MSPGPPPLPIAADASRIECGTYDYCLISISGAIRDAYIDETDKHAHFILLDCHGTVVPLVVFSHEDQTARIRKLIGRELIVAGPCRRLSGNSRLSCGRYLTIDDLSTLEKAATRDPFDVPECSELMNVTPHELNRIGQCRFSGRILATWQRNRALVETVSQLSSITLSEPRLPPVGAIVDVAGFVTTDLKSINLFNAVWRPSEESVAAVRPDRRAAPSVTSTGDLFGRAPDGRRTINAKVHGETFLFRGAVKALSPDGTLALDVDSQLLDIDASSSRQALDGIGPDDTVAVSGICIVDRDAWSPQQPFPRTHGVLLVVRDGSDVRLIAHPSWWTRGRLLVLLAVLAGIVCVVSVWNFFLNRLADRRGRLLFQERIARESANLRASERTRLATELHDSISQNMAAIACELTAARRSGAHDPAAAIAKLPSLERMMQSCRTELRQCLFDLRSNLLDERDLATAIRRSLQQICDTRCVTMRLHLSRSQLRDTTMHAIVRIVRELVSNALRHGNAAKIRISGAIDGRTLRFAVTDDGCGFDAASRPGPETGHFGLAGIETRLQNLKGSLRLISTPGNGTRAEFTLPLTDNDQDEKD